MRSSRRQKFVPRSSRMPDGIGEKNRDTCSTIEFDDAGSEAKGGQGTRRSDQVAVAPREGDRRVVARKAGGRREVKVLSQRISSHAFGEIRAVCIDLYAQ